MDDYCYEYIGYGDDYYYDYYYGADYYYDEYYDEDLDEYIRACDDCPYNDSN